MAKPIPFPTKLHQGVPPETPVTPADIDPTKANKADIQESPQVEVQPPMTPLEEVTPEETALKDETLEPSPPKDEYPTDAIKENCVKIGGKIVEIKPTKVKYFRNKTASAYNWLKLVPLTEFLTYQKGQLDPNRDADQILYDFLVAAFDDSQIVRDNYDEMSADDVEQIVKIIGRINHIDEKEEAARKNREAQAKH